MIEVNSAAQVRFMKKEDIDQVLLIERRSFPAPWSKQAYLSELNNKFARYFVLLEGEQVIGYSGMWVFAGESHITTIAVHPDYRSLGYGRMLMLTLIEYSKQRGVDTMILEVRVSNSFAIKLYAGLGFKRIGVRRNYYIETREDAIVMLRHLKQENETEREGAK
jgi:ribosomal-protein-alanine N-acetyltransferase